MSKKTSLHITFLIISVLFIVLKYAGNLAVALLLLVLTVGVTDRAAARLSRHTGLPKRLWAWVVIVGSLLFFGTVGALILWIFLSECRSLLLSVSDGRSIILILIDKIIFSISFKICSEYFFKHCRRNVHRDNQIRLQ